MDTKARANSIIAVAVNEAMTEMTFTVKDAGACVLRLARLSEVTRLQATWHGIKQKVGDAAAMSKDTVTGKPASPSEKLTAMREVVEHLESGGQWNRTGGGGSGDTVMLINCLREIYPQLDDNTLVGKVTGMTPAQRKAMLISDKVAPIVRRMTAERVKDVDTDALFMDLDTMG